ncbi:MAG: hypothetical protein JSR30_00110 [Proteobacteria bacterium]|nr:hypothetical protein [Pseudomonadota bacterium]
MVYQNTVAVPREELNDVVMESVTTDEQFIGLQLLPAKPMNLPTGHVPKIEIGKGNLMRASRKKRSPGATFDRWQSAISDHSITLLQTSEEVLLPDEQTMLYEDYFAFESVYAVEATNRLRRGHEIDVETAIFDPSALTATNTLVAWTYANIATMTPVTDILNCIRRLKAVGEAPNTIAFPGPIYDLVRQSADMKSFIAGSINPGAIVTTDTIQAAFAKQGIKQVLVGESYVNESDSTNSDVINAIWPNTYVFVGSCQPGELKSGGVGRSFFWEKEGPLFNIQSYRDENRKSNVIRALKTTSADLTNTRCGQLITTQYS